MSEVKVDTISERTSANGVAVDGVTIKDSGLTIPSGGTLTINSGGTITNSGTATGFGGVTNIHMSSADADFAIGVATWTKVIHNVNFTGNTNFNTTTGVYTVGTGEGGYYFANFNCNVHSTTNGGAGKCWSGIYVNDAIKLKGRADNGAGYGLGLAVPSTGILDLDDGDEVTIYAYGSYSTVIQEVRDEAGLHTASLTMFRIGDS